MSACKLVQIENENLVVVVIFSIVIITRLQEQLCGLWLSEGGQSKQILWCISIGLQIVVSVRWK